MSFFSWSDDTALQASQRDQRIALEEQIRNLMARRKILNEKINQALDTIEQWEIEKRRVSHLEDVLLDDLDKMVIR